MGAENIQDGLWQQREGSAGFRHDGTKLSEQVFEERRQRRRPPTLQLGNVPFDEAARSAAHRNFFGLEFGNFDAELFDFVRKLSDDSDDFRRQLDADRFGQNNRDDRFVAFEVF